MVTHQLADVPERTLSTSLQAAGVWQSLYAQCCLGMLKHTRQHQPHTKLTAQVEASERNTMV
jgi:hypothetical protein